MTTDVLYSNLNLLYASPDANFPLGLNGPLLPLVQYLKHVYFTTGFRDLSVDSCSRPRPPLVIILSRSYLPRDIMT